MSTTASTKSRARAKAVPKVTTPPVVPPLHLVMIASTVGLIVLTMVAYYFAPTEKAAHFLSLTTLLVGFLTGKLSNGFGQKFDGTDKERGDGDDSE
jgi:uncharacterized membrane protein YbhN (UPF0104 family)